jgi:putative hydrolase of the HAD superfamily
MRRFDAVLFDFGGVMVSSPFDLVGTAGAKAGVDPAVVLDLMMGDYTADTDHPWHRLERGEIEMAEYAIGLVTRCQEAGVELDFSAMKSFYGQLTVHEPMVDAVRRLKNDRYGTGLLTNNVREAGAEWRTKLPLDELFDVIVDSCEVGMRKPNPAIYQLALDRLGGVEPARAVFLDDAPGNVVGAQRAGLEALLVGDPDEAVAALDRLLEQE